MDAMARRARLGIEHITCRDGYFDTMPAVVASAGETVR
ncbi:MAG: hypothetical protein GAK41_01412 [Burkholderia gladioli]|nr:MAG: hypothetical protein GAK41_01412 [Burkholderia gladioli]